MLEIIRQLALDTAEAGADFCIGVVMAENPLTIRLEKGMELTEEFLVLTEQVMDREEKGTIQFGGGEWSSYRMKRNGSLKKGEAAALLRAADGQQYLVLGRVKKGDVYDTEAGSGI